MLLQAIADRRSIRSYKADKIPPSYITDLVKAAQFAPCAKHNRSVQFILIEDNKKKAQLYSLLGQGFVRQAPILIIPVVDIQKSLHPIQDLSVASENIFIQAAACGLGSIWKNVRKGKMKAVKKLLGIPAKFMLVNVIPVGFPKKEKPPHTNSDFSPRKIHFEKW
ncbi:hypothetical protein FJY90_06040 [Candidatus Gottesmanbacteria bacterium]|nr:hypothetical protein [Candidatus Gottesmanbacteria bacterium]